MAISLISHNHSCAMEPASWPQCLPIVLMEILLWPSTIGGIASSRDTHSIARSFPGLLCGKKTALAGMPLGMEKHWFAALSLATALCHWDSIRHARSVLYLIHPCSLPLQEYRAS